MSRNHAKTNTTNHIVSTLAGSNTDLRILTSEVHLIKYVCKYILKNETSSDLFETVINLNLENIVTQTATNSAFQSIYKALRFVIVCRTVTLQESQLLYFVRI